MIWNPTKGLWGKGLGFHTPFNWRYATPGNTISWGMFRPQIQGCTRSMRSHQACTQGEKFCRPVISLSFPTIRRWGLRGRRFGKAPDRDIFPGLVAGPTGLLREGQMGGCWWIIMVDGGQGLAVGAARQLGRVLCRRDGSTWHWCLRAWGEKLNMMIDKRLRILQSLVCTL
jgi:hypothetical protein